VKRYFVNDYCSDMLRGLLHVPADLTSEKLPGYKLNICSHSVVNLFKIIICNNERTALRIIQRTQRYGHRSIQTGVFVI
jgi:hypothetical protein